MDTIQLATLILGSAAIGALVSSVIAAIAQWRERKSRREELALTKAIEMAHKIHDTTLEMARMMKGKTIVVPSDNELVEGYYLDLKHILDHGRLSDEARAAVAAYKNTPEYKDLTRTDAPSRS
jgi:hypothetical protein